MGEGSGIIFAKGHLIAVGAGPGGADVEFGELQDCSFEKRDTYKEARGPDSVYPLAREMSESSMTLRASYLKVKAQGIKLLLGGDVSYANNKTTIAVSKSSVPSTFKAHLKSPSDGSAIELILYKVSPENFTLPFAMRDFTIPNFECTILVDEDNEDKVCDIILPGYQSTN
jgi:hypothetical protein